MNGKKILFVVGIIVAVAVGLAAIKFFSTTEKSDAKLSGIYLGSQIWSGEIVLTGDTLIFGDLTVKPDTKIKFEVGDDRGSGDEVPADGFNDKDPTRLKSYGITHTNLFIFKKLLAEGTPDRQILFTSAAEQPNLADWEAVIFRGNGSILDNVTVEYNRNGLNPTGNQPDSIIKNSLIRHSLWGGISSANSNIQIIGNQFSDNGHEGIDLKHKGPQIVKNNLISDCHTGIASIAGKQTIENNVITDCGDGVYISEMSASQSINNKFTPAPEDSQRVWRYGDYIIPIFGIPEI